LVWITPRAAPRLARTPFLTVQESGGTCDQPSRVLPSKIGFMPGGSGTEGGGTAPMPAIACAVVGAVVGAVAWAERRAAQRNTIDAKNAVVT
jgi:hypothetical protein